MRDFVFLKLKIFYFAASAVEAIDGLEKPKWDFQQKTN